MNIVNPPDTTIKNENTQEQLPNPPVLLQPPIPQQEESPRPQQSQEQEESPLQTTPPPEKQQEQPKKKTIKIKLVNQGTYGCIYTPEISCDTGEPGDIRYVSKIQKNTETIQNEIVIGELVKKINNYSFFFSIIESVCPVSISKIEREEQEKCKVISDNKDPITNSKYISGKIRYVSKMNIEDYFLTLPREPDLLCKKLYTSYVYVLKSLQKLYEQGIIHYDIKEKNVMYDEHNHSPIIIDFGLSFVPSAATTEELQNNALYTNLFYPYWRFDAFVLSYITCSVRKNQAETNVTQEQINALVTNFMKEFIEFNKSYSILLTEIETNTMATNYAEMLATYIGEPWEKVFEDFFQPEFYSTWDLYSASVTFLIISKSIKATEFETPVIAKMIELWKSIVVAIPNQCKSMETILQEMHIMV
jgi:serine/threonine protein kinase